MNYEYSNGRWVQPAKRSLARHAFCLKNTSASPRIVADKPFFFSQLMTIPSAKHPVTVACPALTPLSAAKRASEQASSPHLLLGIPPRTYHRTFMIHLLAVQSVPWHCRFRPPSLAVRLTSVSL